MGAGREKGHDEPDQGSGRLYTAAEVLDAVRASGLSLSARTFGSWRERRLAPAPVRGRSADGTATWTYDRQAVETVVEACRWRAVTRDLDVIRVRLWLARYPQPGPDVRASLARVTARVARAFAVATRDGDPVAIDSVAGLIARSRPRDGTGLPRFSRTSLADRTEAIAYLVRLYGFGESAPPPERVARNAEKVLGVSRGRRRTSQAIGPWLDGPATAMAGAARSASLPAMRDAVTTATDSELLTARTDVATLARFLPLVVEGIAALTGDKSAAGMVLAGHLMDPGAPVLLVPLVVSLRRDPILAPGARRGPCLALGRRSRRTGGPQLPRACKRRGGR